ncbi:MAG: hypothetical protein JJT89_09285 [Nitriliruptoraceae bacterium]|nr:hypothetical protein [Nitriliruptoraceae bacterium]
MSELLPPTVHGYLDDLVTAEVYDPIVVELERRAEATGRPIPGRAVGRHLEVVLSSADIVEVAHLDAGFGALTYWLARAVGAQGVVHTIGTDPADAAIAEDVLRRAGTFARTRPVPADGRSILETLRAVADGAALGAVVGDVALDADTTDTTDTTHGPASLWQAAADRIRIGGLLVVLGVLRGADGTTPVPTHDHVVREVVNDPRFVTTIAPLRDGVLVARRIPDEDITLY